jgi:hypothetical protein
MADANQSAQELSEMMERVNREMAVYGQLHKSTADDMRDAQMKAKYGITNFTKGTETAAGALTSVAKAGMEGAKAMYEGKKGAAAFNSSIDELATAAKLAGAALTLLVPGGPIMKLFIAGITAAATATAEYVKKANEMADKIYDGYSKLAKAGGAASDGMTGVYQGAKKLGLSMNELDSYVGLISENAGDLSLFAGSVFEGRKKFEEMGAAMEPYRKGLIAAGYTQQEINDASMQYLRLQTRIGASQNLTTKELAEGAKKYLNEQDALTKLTGQNRKEQEQAIESARSQQRFRAKLEEMRNSGDQQQIDAAAEMLTTYKMLYQRSKTAAEGYGDLATGMMGTEAAMKLYQSTQGEAMAILDKQKAGQLDGIKAFELTGKAVGRVTKEMNYLFQMGVGEDFMIKINEGAELGIAANKDLSDEYKKIKKEQEQQGMDGAKAADGITDQYAANIKKQQELNKAMEDAVFKGISNAQSVTSGLASATETLTSAFSTLTTGINKLLRILGLGEKVDKVAEKQQEVASASKSLEIAKAAQKSAKTPEEKAVADREVKFYDEKMKLLEQEKATLAAEDKNAKLDAQILKRANDELAIKKAAYDKAMETASLKQKMGFGLDKDQEKARTEMWESVAKQRALQRNEGGARDQARAEAAKAGGAALGGGSAKSASAPTQTSQKQLSEAGLKIKTGDVQAEGAVINPKIIEMAEQIQANMPNFAYFSGFNDKFHQENAPSSEHTKGNAMDFALSKPPSAKEGQEIVKYLKSMGASLAIDEYNNPSSKATAGHIHAQVPGYADGGIAKTPQIAFVAEKGPEVMLPLGPDGSIPLTIKGGQSKPQMIEFPDDIKKFFQLQGQLDSLKFLQDTGSKDTFVDQAPEVMDNQVKMFAELADMKLQLTNQGWDKQMLENYGEEQTAAKETVDLDEQYKDDDSQVWSTAVVDAVKQGAAQTGQMIELLSELIRVQKDQNDISQKILTVSSN